MNNKMHFFKKDDDYVLYDCDRMQFFLIPSKVGSYIEKLKDDEKYIFIDEALKAASASRNIKVNNESNYYDDKICSRLVLVITQTCNLECKYCYAEKGTYGQEDKIFMDFETATNAIKFFVNMFPNGISAIQFFGGEPLLNVDLIEEVCAWCKEYFNTKNLSLPIFTISTNGTLINQKVIDIRN